MSDTFDAQVCSDCLIASAGYSEHELGQAYSVEHPPLSMFACYDDYAIDLTDDEPHFSSHACDGCGETLAGDRYDATVTVLS